MGWVSKTPAGTFRANWRDPSGRQKAKTFKTKREANAYLAEVERAMHRGLYIDPNAGKVLFGVYADDWLRARHVETTTAARTLSVLRVHVRPRWSSWPLAKIGHRDVQEWVNELSGRLAPASVAKCYGALSMILAAAVRERLIPFNPAEGVKLPSTHKPRRQGQALSRQDFLNRLLPAVPVEYRALVALAGGAGLRWGECAGLPWSAVDLDNARVHIRQVLVEVGGTRTVKPFPKSKAGLRTVPLPDFVVKLLRARRDALGDAYKPTALVFPGSTGEGLLRASFRRDVWRPALVRAGLLGRVEEIGPDRWRASWVDQEGVEWIKEFTTERDAVAYLVEYVPGGLRFHDLRHSYATWLVSKGLPVNVVQRVLGHEAPSTTLNLYTHAPSDYDSRVRHVLDDAADDLLTDKPGGELDP